MRRRPLRKRRSARHRLVRLARRRLGRLVIAALAALAFALLAWSGPARAQEGAVDTAPGAPVDSAASAGSVAPAPDLLTQARELTAEKRFEDAAVLLRDLVRAEPGNTEALSLLARVLAWSRRFDESIATYERLLELTPGDAASRAGYARALAWSGRHPAALREFRRAIAGDSTNLETRVGYARALSWAGDLAGASNEYRRVLRADSSYGDAWIGLATVARWRGAATASDRFTDRAESRGADPNDVREERGATRPLLRPETGAGWTLARERQYVGGSTPFELEASGPFAYGAAAIEGTLGLRARAGRYRLWERRSALPSDTTQNYDLRASVFEGDLSLLRFYPVQLSLGATLERLEARSPRVLFPLRGAADFFGPRARVWGYWGRFTPSAGVTRDFFARKTTAATGSRRLETGGVTNGEIALGWQPDARWSAGLAGSKGFYSDGNERTGARAEGAWRARVGRPRLALDYAWSWTDYDFASGNYFTPLASVKHSAGISLDGWADRPALNWGARYQVSPILSGNFDDIVIHSWSGYFDVIVADAVPLSVEGWYSVDNNDYTTRGATVSAGLRW